MAIFSRKSKAAKEDVKKEEKASSDAKPKRVFVPTQNRSMPDLTGTPSSSKRASMPSQRNQSQVFVTDPNAPPIPEPPQFLTGGRARSYRKSSDYFSQRGMPMSGQEMPSLGYGNSTEPGFNTPYYADSGYESNGSHSAMQSRAPSELNLDEARYQAPRNTAFLPELRLGDDVSGTRMIDPASYRKSQDIVLESGNNSPVDRDADAKSLKSNKSVNKRTRFEEVPEPVPTVDYLSLDLPEHTLSKELDAQSEAYSKPSTGPRQLDPPTPSLTQGSTTLNSRRTSTLPPLSILEGRKVNKKGKILDEEGDPIGELVEGDLLDCVRQKVNSNGEVLDEYGRVVGIVRTIAGTVDLPTPTASARTPAPPALQTLRRESQDEPRRVVEPLRPALSLHTRSASTASRTGLQQTFRSVEPKAVEEEVRSQPVMPTPVPQVEPQVIPREEPQAKLSEEIEQSIPQSVDVQQQGEVLSEVLPSAKDFAAQEQPRRQAPSLSERSLSELTKTYVRPSMTPVPENNVPEDEILPDNPNLYAFKGEIPLDDRPQREARSRSPNVAINPKAALALGQPNSAVFASMSTGPYSHGSRMGPRRATTQFTGNYSYRPSPLSSHETSPKRSEAGTDSASDDGRPIYMRNTSMQSAASVPARPRTYFSHAGKVTVDPDAPKPEKPVVEKPAAPVAEKAVDKKKSRLSMGFGKKGKTAAK